MENNFYKKIYIITLCHFWHRSYPFTPPPPLWSPIRSFKWYQSRLLVLIDSNQSKIQGWHTRNEVRVLHTSMGRTTRCGVSGWRHSSAERVGFFGMSQWTQAMSNWWTSSLQDRGTCLTPTIRWSTTFLCFVSIRIRLGAHGELGL
jgi:hypothetical protein